MPDWRDRFAAAPLWVIALVSAALVAAYFDAIALAGGEPARSLPKFSLAGGGIAVLVTAVAAVNRWWVHRVAGRHPRDARVSMAAAFRTGRPPTDPALDGPLLALIERRKADRARLRRWRPAVVVLLIVWCGLGLYVDLVDWRPPVVVLVLILAVLVPLQRRQRNRYRLLEERIRARGSAEGRREEAGRGGS
ncbi:hypothetical protein [Actinomadura verrucosospora]|uniref:Transmembrane protein n=1 Tax=Actinomadura verrucosospora TaxID=46165 RepID=A0A7D3VSY6_ACTVE|nr:hypothetical protein [Actinomadura verrucosospora]QKG21833.1 hypothetical protein ACTIVE_3471 [Actinomadura verrucosospora]